LFADLFKSNGAGAALYGTMLLLSAVLVQIDNYQTAGTKTVLVIRTVGQLAALQRMAPPTLLFFLPQRKMLQNKYVVWTGMFFVVRHVRRNLDEIPVEQLQVVWAVSLALCVALGYYKTHNDESKNAESTVSPFKAAISSRTRTTMPRPLLTKVGLLLLLFVSSATETIGQTVSNDHCADVVDAAFTPPDTIVATVSSPYENETGWDQYADAFQVHSAADGTLLGTRVLAHPHATEQPCSRSLTGIAIDDSTISVFISARDSING